MLPEGPFNFYANILPETTSQSLMASSSSRPLPLRVRPDLTTARRSWQGREYWVVKDPITLKYYRFEEEEYRLLMMLDGKICPDEIRQNFEYQFAPQKISMRELHQLIGMLYRSSLLVSDATDQGNALLNRSQERKSALFRQSLTNIMAIRFKGFDPDGLLNFLNPVTQYFFTVPVFLMVMLLWLAAGALLFAQFDMFLAKLPSMDQFFASSNWLWLAVVLGVTKVIHELGHGLVCKKYGGQCHEMGAMLLVFTPCLYMNVSDSWMLKSKWQRAFIAAAGMYVELILAAIAVFVWWFSHPGMVNQLALNVIFVCSISTLVFNANPLLRYDGYYILSDLLEIPNLRAKATKVLQNYFGSICLGLEQVEDPFLPQRHQWMFAFYSVAAAAYRWFITFSIFWLVYGIFEPYGFKILGQGIAMMAIWGLVGMPVVKLIKFFSIPGRTSAVKQTRLAITGIVVAGLIAAICFFPIPHHVYCTFKIQPAGAVNVYAKVPGRLVDIWVSPNTRVSKGQTLVSLESVDLNRQIVQLTSAQTTAKANLGLIRFASSRGDEGRGARLEESQAVLDTATGNLEQRKLDHRLLEIKAPAEGYLLAPSRVREEKQSSKDLNRWTGTPLEGKNMGAWIEPQTVIGQIVPRLDQFDAVLAIDQKEIDFVQLNQAVELHLNQFPLTPFKSAIKNLSPVKMVETPAALSSKHGGELLSITSSQGNDVPASTTYRVSVPLVVDEQPILSGGTGTAKIRVGSQTVGQRVWRLLCHTFHFDL